MEIGLLLADEKYSEVWDKCSNGTSFVDLDASFISSFYLTNGRSEEYADKILEQARKSPEFARQLRQHFSRVERNLSKVHTQRQISILCFANAVVGTWDPDSTTSGISGSEEAVIYLAQELAKKYRVTVYANPPEKSLYRLSSSNPQYKSVESYFTDEDCSTCILWRQTDFLAARKKASNVLFWPHDVCTSTFSIEGCNGVLWLSSEQKKQYVEKNPLLENLPSVLCGNGISLSQFSREKKGGLYKIVRKNPFSCIYASNYARGLTLLIEIWPQIRKKFPRATLDIYYGWQTWGCLNQSEITELKRKVEDCRKLGVTEHGKVGHEELAQAFGKSSLWTYPCTAYETFCITATKAQAAGCIPVVILDSALIETVEPSAPSVPLNSDSKKNYLQLLLQTMDRISNSTNQIEKERQTYINFASNWSWENCASKVETLF